MRNLLLPIALSMLLTGCISDRELPGLKPKFAAAEAAQPLVTPTLINECAIRVAKEAPSARASGPYALSAQAAGYFNDVEELWPTDNIVALVAPTGRVGEFIGCSYRLQKGALVLHKVYGPTSREIYTPTYVPSVRR